jgi:hypothetical protein
MAKKKSKAVVEIDPTEATKQRIVDDTFTVGESRVTFMDAQAFAAHGLIEMHPDDAASVNAADTIVRVRATQKLADEFPSQVVGNDVASITATASGATSGAQDSELVKDNPTMATEAVAVDQTSAQANTAPIFAVASGVPLKGSLRITNGGKPSKYPFAQLQPPTQGPEGTVYFSFHIPTAADSKNGNPAKTFAGVVSTATMQAKKKATVKDSNGVETVGKYAHYVIRRVDASDPAGEGARVYRTE